jgi:hypothetical protein
MQGFLEVSTGVLSSFWIQVAVSLLKPPHGFSEVKLPLRSRSRSEAVTDHGHSPTDAGVRSGVTVM